MRDLAVESLVPWLVNLLLCLLPPDFMVIKVMIFKLLLNSVIDTRLPKYPKFQTFMYLFLSP
jgi:hypothetical protein